MGSPDRMRTSFCGLELENPFLLASAPPTASGPLIRAAFNYGWAGAVLKTVNPDPMPMEDVSPRFAALRVRGEVLGFENIELLSRRPVAYWEEAVASLKAEFPTRLVIASIMGDLGRASWQELALRMQEAGSDALELNFSCPHGMPERGVGAAIGQHEDLTERITAWVKEVARVPVIVKLSPNVTDVACIARAAQRGGADALAAINTIQCLLGVDLERLEPLPSVGGHSAYGGYSGRAVKPIGLRVVAQAIQATGLPVLGMGGIEGWEDAAEYLAVGASAVQVCTAVMLKGFSLVHPLCKGLDAYLERKGFDGPEAIRGRALAGMQAHETLVRNRRLRAYELHPERCTLCQRCAVACADGGSDAIEVLESELTIDLERCDGCSLCTFVCPHQVLALADLGA